MKTVMLETSKVALELDALIVALGVMDKERPPGSCSGIPTRPLSIT